MLNNKLIACFFAFIILIILILNISMCRELDKLNRTIFSENFISSDRNLQVFTKIKSQSSKLSKKSAKNSHHIALIYKQNGVFTDKISAGARMIADNDQSIDLQEFMTSPAGQFKISDYVNLAILAGYDGIILDSENPQLLSVINKAAANNIPVITILSDLPGSDRISYVGVNNHRAGYTIGRTVLQQFNNKIVKLAIVSNNYSGNNQTPVAEYLKIFGFKEAISSYKNARIITWKKVEPNILDESEIILNILKEHPDINCLFTTNTTATLAAANIKNKYSADFFLIGYGNNQQLDKYLKQGILNANIYVNPIEIGRNSVREIINYLQEKKANIYSNIKIKMITAEKNWP